MKQCLKITFSIPIEDGFLHAVIQNCAREHSLEGTVQAYGDSQIKIVVCGNKERIDDFLDAIHNYTADKEADNVEVEPFLKERDYRGVFRVIE